MLSWRLGRTCPAYTPSLAGVAMSSSSIASLTGCECVRSAVRCRKRPRQQCQSGNVDKTTALLDDPEPILSRRLDDGTVEEIVCTISLLVVMAPTDCTAKRMAHGEKGSQITVVPRKIGSCAGSR
ncbi:unnamed protein product [Protopolystoma xenopodis]|uniref:Uncharacterized protein n=1 Tax=Protopolystoma xenopodis TaxID=117903 RepID=A0A3S5AWA0_9PLAT|nr:unnamed protein product [Protopolystoma xenopodis]